MRIRRSVVRQAVSLALACLLAMPTLGLATTASPAAAGFTGGPLSDDTPLFVPNDHTPQALRFSASGLAPDTAYEVKIRLSPTPYPGGTSIRGFTWNPGTQSWSQNRALDWGAGNYPTITTDSSGDYTPGSDWFFFKFGNEIESGQYYIIVTLNAGGPGTSVNASVVPGVTVLDMKTEGVHVHAGSASATTAADDRRVILAPDDSVDNRSVVWAISRTEANNLDDDSDGLVDNEDWGLLGAPGGYRMAAPATATVDVWVQSNRKVDDFVLPDPDEDIALGAADTTAPSAPRALRIERSYASAALEWEEASDDTGVDHYRVYRWADSGSVEWTSPKILIGTTTDNSYVDDSVAGVTYKYEVRAVDEATNVSRRANTAPIAAADTYETTEDTALVIAAPGVLENDDDADGDALSAVLGDDVANGTLALETDGGFTYTPDEGFVGTDTFTYVATDGTDDSNAATVSITVTEGEEPPVNTAPVAADDAYETTKDTALTIAAPGVLSNDTDEDDGDTLSALKVTDPQSGTLALSADGGFTYTPDAGFVGTDTFTYAATDGTDDSDAATVSITVTEGEEPPVNTAPVAADDAYEVTQDTTLTIAAPGVLSNDTDADDGDTLTAVKVTDPQSGTLALETDGGFTYTPDEGFVGTDTFTYAATDGTDDSNAATVSITVTEPDDPDPTLPAVIEVAGADRYATAVEASKLAYPDGAETVVIATGRNWPDALGGTALAGVLDAPILLVATDSVPGVTAAEIARLKATKAVILGGDRAVGETVASALQSSGLGVERIAGTSRYETADKVAARVKSELGDAYDGTAFVATGAKFPDALAAAPLAAAGGWPLFLAHPTSGLSDASKAEMAGTKTALILGGTDVVSPATESYLKTTFGDASVTRLAGPSRYDTAAVVAAFGVAEAGLSWNRVGITTGQKFPDALAGGVLQGKARSVMLLTRSDSLEQATRDALSANKAAITTVTYFGGDLAVSAAVRAAVAQALASSG